jgi:hypothetical protein
MGLYRSGVVTLELRERPLRITKKLVDQTIDEMTGILERAPLDTRVAWVRDLFERVDVDSCEHKAVAICDWTTEDRVNRSNAVTESLRRAGAGCVLNSRLTSSEVPLPRAARSREWLAVALTECQRCHHVVERRASVQRHCHDCR